MTLSRRDRTFNIKLERIVSVAEPIDLVIEIIELSIHGEGCWMRHKHGRLKCLSCRKFNIGVSDDTSS